MSASMPPVGTRGICERCGKTVWLRSVGTIGLSPTLPTGTRIFQWCVRRGTKGRPVECPVSDGWPSTHHTAEGYETRYYLPPDDSAVE